MSDVVVVEFVEKNHVIVYLFVFSYFIVDVRGRSGILDRLLNWTTPLKSNFIIRAHRGPIYRITLYLKSSRQREDGERGG